MSRFIESLTDRFMIETLREWQPVSFQGWAGRAYGLYLAGLACLVVGMVSTGGAGPMGDAVDYVGVVASALAQRVVLSHRQCVVAGGVTRIGGGIMSPMGASI